MLILPVLMAVTAPGAAAQVSLGILANQVRVSEAHQAGDTGYGSGMRLGLPVWRAVALEVRYGQARIDHASIEASYDLWEAHLGARYRFRRDSDRVRPFVDLLSTVQVGRLDRNGITPGPDHSGVGAGVGAGVNIRLLWGFWVAVSADASRTWLRAGRVENGDWIRLKEDDAVRTRTSRLTAGINWNP